MAIGETELVQPGRRISLSAGLAALVLSGLCLGCDELDPQVVGRQRASGVIRLSDESFGLLIYPCGNELVSEVELGVLDLASQAFNPILREVFDSPAASSSLVVSTDPTAVSSGARREILDDALLVRVNTDPTFMTAPWPPSPKSVLEILAMTPGSSTDIAGTADIPLNGRFDLDVGQADVYGHPAKLSDFRCFGEHHRAWQPSNAVS